MFNDDVQGTGAVILGGFSTAVKASGVDVRDHRAIFLGAGSAGVGVAKQLVEFFMKEGLTEDEARRKFWFVDSNGLVTNDRGDKLADHKIYFSRDDNNGQQFNIPKFKIFCLALHIDHRLTSVGHPQSNGEVEVTNRTILQDLKAKLGQAKGLSAEEFHSVLWTYQTTPRISIKEMPFNLAFRTEVVIPVEINLPMIRVK